MPSNWYTLHESKVAEDDDTETTKQKEFNFRIAAAKKPYFMTYVYPRLKSENDTYIKNNNKSVIRRFNQYGINSISDLENFKDKTQSMQEFLNYYYARLPVGNNLCVINRISWLFESVFQNYMSKFSKIIRETNITEFDYSILKSGVVYSKANYNKICEIYKEYLRRVEKYQKESRTEKIDKYEAMLKYKTFSDFFKSECERICTNEDELCDIILDICYVKEKSKQFVWDICGNVILKNLLRRSNNTIHYPELVDENGDFEYCGKQFKMCEKQVEVK